MNGASTNLIFTRFALSSLLPVRTLLLMLMFGALDVIALAQLAPPYVTAIAPTGGQRGKTVTFTIEGYNLSGASKVLWNKPGITATVLLNAETAREAPRPSTDPTKRYQGDRGTRNRVQIQATIAPNAEAGVYRYRLLTPLGTTNLGTIYIGEWRETAEREENNSPEQAQMVQWPTTITGEMQQRGDADYFKFNAQAGDQLVFEVIASGFGSRLDSVLTLFDEQGKQLAHNNDAAFQRDSLLAWQCPQTGVYLLRVTDFEQQGMGKPLEFAYRLNVGKLPYMGEVYPLGLALGSQQRFGISGYNLGTANNHLTTNIAAPATQPFWGEALTQRVSIGTGQTANAVRLALGSAPEIQESAALKTLAQPQAVTVPVTINGRLQTADKTQPGEDFFRFHAKAGQTLWLEVGAQRFGSLLDSVLEIYDAQGKLVPRAVLRCVWETSQTLNDRDSASRGIRIVNWNGVNVDDYFLIGNELLQVDVLPKGPDEDIFFKSFAGQRLGLLDTTPEAHAVNTAVYKVSLHPPGTQLPPNGLPQTTLYYRNDDGGPMYGKDARLTFTAPTTGEYTVRLRDVRGLTGEHLRYRLTIRAPQPDFTLTLDPENPNVPRGAAIPINVTAFRAEGFAGEISVQLHDLPAGFSATTGLIRQGVNTTTMLLSAASDLPADTTFPLSATGTATINGQSVTRRADTRERLALASIAATPELRVWTDQPVITLAPGGSAWVSLKIQREQLFKGRIPFDVRNLPHGVIVKDVGLNGVLITEDETTQRFELAAEPWVKAQEQPIIVIGRIETASPQRYESPAQPFTLRIRAQP